MRNRGRAAATLAFALAVTAALTAPSAAAPHAVADPVTAPYVDITASEPSPVDIANATGHKTFTLADSSGRNRAWGGTIPLDDQRIIDDITALRAPKVGRPRPTGSRPTFRR